LLLDLFCGEGGAARGYDLAGFDVVGVDIRPQPKYPYDFLQDDAMAILQRPAFLHLFDAFHASPPCQDNSRSKVLNPGLHHSGWMLPATIGALCARGRPWIVENVGDAVMPSAVTMCGTVFGHGLHRHRRFETSFMVLSPGCDQSRVKYRGRDREVYGHHGNTDRVKAEWGVEWMTRNGTSQCVPPAFTEYLGKAMLEAMAWA
jgi:DNA (cytosine-5)-methyltransferase 1